MNDLSPSRVEMVIPLPMTVDAILASDIEKESVFVSPHLERVVVEPDRASVRAILKNNAPMEEVRDKVTRYLEAMAKQVSGYKVKVFLENERKDTGEYEADANLKLAEAGWLHDYGKGQVAYSPVSLN